ncbi:MAG: hypothetical protein GYA17_18315 [Chloroflexi bacterium]|nr:hypothetical protein [Chloroflexota bacterium]
MKLRIFLAAWLALAAVLTWSGSASAHGHVEVGDYELVIGFRNEPAYQGEPNGLELVVTDHATGQAVTGLEDSLRVEITYGASTQELTLTPLFGEEGAYTAHVLPTEAGDYTWHIFGAIGDTPVDVSLTSGPDTFSPVTARSQVSFPGQEPALTEVNAAVQSAAQTAQTALWIAAAGLVLGLAGLGFGLAAWRRARA